MTDSIRPQPVDTRKDRTESSSTPPNSDPSHLDTKATKIAIAFILLAVCLIFVGLPAISSDVRDIIALGFSFLGTKEISLKKAPETPQVLEKAPEDSFVSNHLKESISENLDKILNEEPFEAIKYYGSSNFSIVLSLQEAPNLFFKLDKSRGYGSISIKERYRNVLKAQKVCKNYHLDRIIIPKTKKFTISNSEKNVTLIAQEKLDFNSNYRFQNRQFKQDTEDFDETIRQLTRFIIHTGHYDIKPENNPVLNKESEFKKTTIGLVDCERFSVKEAKVKEALFNPEHGLISFLKPSEQESVRSVARSFGLA